jgi:hypothetical protein
MRIKIVLGIATTIMIMLASNLYAATATELWTFWKTRQLRQQEAQKWRDGFIKLDAQIPTLSPAEQHWLKTEIDDEITRSGNRYTKRALDAMNSREYDLRIAKPQTDELVRILSELSRPTLSEGKLEVIL